MKMKYPIRSPHRFQYTEKHGVIQADLPGKTTSLLTVLESKYNAWETVRVVLHKRTKWMNHPYILWIQVAWQQGWYGVRWDVQPHASHRITYLLFPRTNPKKHKARLLMLPCKRGAMCSLLSLCFSVLIWGRSPVSATCPLPCADMQTHSSWGLSAILPLKRNSVFSSSNPSVGFHSMYLVCYQTRDEYSVPCPISCSPKSSAYYLRQVYLEIHFFYKKRSYLFLIFISFLIKTPPDLLALSYLILCSLSLFP